MKSRLGVTGREIYMGDQRLRKALIRLAYTKPEFRQDLLPLLRSAAGTASPVHSRGGKYYKRRAKDSRIVVMKPREAQMQSKTPADPHSPPQDPDGALAIFYVPPEYEAAREGKWRIESGYIKPIWTWDFGPSREEPYPLSW